METRMNDNPFWRFFDRLSELLDEYGGSDESERFPEFFDELGAILDYARECAMRLDE